MSRVAVAPPQPTEADIQRAIGAYLDRVLPQGSMWAAIPGGEYRVGAREGFRLKRLGARAGMPDILIVHDGRALFFEVKRPGSYPTAVQRATHDALRIAGCRVSVVRSVDDARAALEAWSVTPSNTHS